MVPNHIGRGILFAVGLSPAILAQVHGQPLLPQSVCFCGVIPGMLSKTEASVDFPYLFLLLVGGETIPASVGTGQEAEVNIWERCPTVDENSITPQGTVKA